ncbi:Slp family lipoprotein [Xanthomonas translucens]|uniref:Slp family lipoprotein n=1 Tax=Xanthomonas campestris pv. translucens TaxID=343 RepID=UPI001F622483|nr:Slp family lipoprotein [Xanthomonas translucens]UNU10210.1 Slp family lipoprotein [Xanthomonas translucens pv. translucens]
MKIRLLFPVMAVLALGACATAPKPLQGQFATVTPRDSVAGQQVGASVRWGGKIIQTKPSQGETCFQILSRPLSASGRPDSDAADASDGRFVACRAGFYDPAVFEPGREVTFIGHVSGYENTRIGEYDYRLPKIDADVVYLWPVVRQVDVVPAYPYGPYGTWDPWGPRWGWGSGWW